MIYGTFCEKLSKCVFKLLKISQGFIFIIVLCIDMQTFQDGIKFLVAPFSFCRNLSNKPIILPPRRTMDSGRSAYRR